MGLNRGNLADPESPITYYCGNGFKPYRTVRDHAGSVEQDQPTDTRSPILLNALAVTLSSIFCE